MNAPVVLFHAVDPVVEASALFKEASGARLTGVALRELSWQKTLVGRGVYLIVE